MQEAEILARVKRVGDFFTLETQVEQRKRKNLCEHCGIFRTCGVRSEIETINRSGTVIVPIKTCRMFRPTLTFADRRGLTLESYNTMRMGRAWFDRLKSGDQVSLVDTKTDENFGIAEVTETHLGTLTDLAGDHGRFNHVLINQPHEDFAEAIYQVLRKSYGQLYVSWERSVSVIYLRWIGNAEEERKALHG